MLSADRSTHCRGEDILWVLIRIFDATAYRRFPRLPNLPSDCSEVAALCGSNGGLQMTKSTFLCLVSVASLMVSSTEAGHRHRRAGCCNPCAAVCAPQPVCAPV